MNTSRAIATKHNSEYTPGMITGAQIRAARALLGWTTQELAKAAGVSYATLSRAEQSDAMPNMQIRTILAVKSALEGSGVIFIDGPYSGTGGAGVRLRD